MKHLTARCTDGGLLITYSGIGLLKSRFSGHDVHISDWVAGVLRGESRTVDETLILLRTLATKRLAPSAIAHHLPHIFNIGGFLGGRPWGILIANITTSAQLAECRPNAVFDTMALPADDRPISLVTGAREAVPLKDLELLQRIPYRRPHRVSDYMRLLADINLRAAQHPKYGHVISPTCIVSYMPPKIDGIQTNSYNWKGKQEQPKTSPILLFGIDVSEMARVVQGLSQAKENADTLTESERQALDEKFQRDTEQAAQRSVRPIDLLSRNPEIPIPAATWLSPDSSR